MFKWNTDYKKYALVPRRVLQPRQMRKADDVMKHNHAEWMAFIVT